MGVHGHSTSLLPMCRTGSRAFYLLHYPTRHSKLPISSSGFCANPSSGILVPYNQTKGLGLCFVSSWVSFI